MNKLPNLTNLTQTTELSHFIPNNFNHEDVV